MKHHTTLSNTNITSLKPLQLEKAIRFIEEAEQQRAEDTERMPRLIATLAATVGWEVILLKSFPKGKVVIGTGEELPLLNKPPKIEN